MSVKIFNVFRTSPHYSNGISEDVRKGISTWQNLSNKCICVLKIFTPCWLHYLAKLEYMVNVIAKHSILYLEAPICTNFGLLVVCVA